MYLDLKNDWKQDKIPSKKSIFCSEDMKVTDYKLIIYGGPLCPHILKNQINLKC